MPDRRSRSTELRAAFETAYWGRFEVELPEIRPVLVNLHTAVIGAPALDLAAPIAAAAPAETRSARSRARRRRVWFDGGWQTRRSTGANGLPLDPQLSTAPAIIEQLDGDHRDRARHRGRARTR